jgi:signal transduction histidine kinase
MEPEFTERVFEDKLEERLIYEIGNISSELTHDLRSPLQTIQNAVFLLERSPNNPVFYRLIKESLAQATKILNNFKDFYKGHLLIKVESDLGKVYQLAMTELKIPEKISLTSEIDVPHRLMIDPGKVSLVFLKLINNSLEAMPDGGNISVKAYETDKSVIVTVSDDGPGISEDVESVIFKPFHSEIKRGTGLGLPACQRIVESHGGTLSYVTEKGRGTTFTFTLPRG